MARSVLVLLVPGVAGEFWQVTSGNCEVVNDCLRSPNFPGDYGSNELCVVNVPEASWVDHEIVADSNFYTEGCCDLLWINSQKYSGTKKPDGVVPQGTITFESDDGSPTTDSSWRLCPKRLESESPSTGSSTVGVIVGAAIGGVVVLLLLLGVALFFFKKRARGSSSTGSSSTGSSSTGSVWIRTSRTSVHVPPEECVPPSYWSIQTLTAGDVQLQSVTSSEQEALQAMIDGTYKTIRTRDRHSEMPKRLKMVQVQRIENSDLWKRYLSGRYAIRNKRSHRCTSMAAYGGDPVTLPFLLSANKRSLQPGVNECYLFHGTTPGGATGISKGGFNLRYSGTRTGSMYGNGVYLAECSSKSDEYAGDDSAGVYKGLYCLLLCRTVLGEMLNLPVGGSAVHETVRAGMEGGAFDSTLGNREASVGTYREFIVYQEDQVYPEYLIVYKREM